MYEENSGKCLTFIHFPPTHFSSIPLTHRFSASVSNKMLSFFVSHQTEVVTSGGIMRKIFYLKLLQIVLILAFIWQLHSLHQFCGTFADPKAFLQYISIGHCKSFTFIGKDTKSGEFGDVFVHHKWHNQLSMSSTNGQLTEEQQCQFFDFLAAKLPPAGRQCIPSDNDYTV